MGGGGWGGGPAQIYDSPQENNLQKQNACNLQNMRDKHAQYYFHAVSCDSYLFLYAAKALIVPSIKNILVYRLLL